MFRTKARKNLEKEEILVRYDFGLAWWLNNISFSCKYCTVNIENNRNNIIALYFCALSVQYTILMFLLLY